MINGLIGHTGFVGGNLARQSRYDRLFHRPNVAEVADVDFDRLVISAAPAEKWRANADPGVDAAAIGGLVTHLRRSTAELAVLISTVDVYPEPEGFDETARIGPDDHPDAYGRHRRRLELVVEEHFERSLIIRLPALIGPGLRKNLVFDLLHGRSEEFTHRDSTFQFYDLRRLTFDMNAAIAADLAMVNFATQPVSAQRIGTEIFERSLTCVSRPVVTYDIHTMHASVFGRSGSYILDQQQVMTDLSIFVADHMGVA